MYREARVETTPVLAREHVTDVDLLFVTTKTYGHALVAQELAAAPAAVAPRIATVLCHNGFMDYEAVWERALGSTAAHGRQLHKSPFFKALVPGGYTFDLEADGNFHVTNAAQPWSLLEDSAAGATAAAALTEHGVAAEAGGILAEAADLKKFLVNNTANLVSCINDTNCEGLFSDASIEQVVVCVCVGVCVFVFVCVCVCV